MAAPLESLPSSTIPYDLPAWLRDLLRGIHELLIQPGVMEHWRAQIRIWDPKTRIPDRPAHSTTKAKQKALKNQPIEGCKLDPLLSTAEWLDSADTSGDGLAGLQESEAPNGPMPLGETPSSLPQHYAQLALIHDKWTDDLRLRVNTLVTPIIPDVREYKRFWGRLECDPGAFDVNLLDEAVLVDSLTTVRSDLDPKFGPSDQLTLWTSGK